jgi:hypothetical protein
MPLRPEDIAAETKAVEVGARAFYGALRFKSEAFGLSIRVLLQKRQELRRASAAAMQARRSAAAAAHATTAATAHFSRGQVELPTKGGSEVGAASSAIGVVAASPEGPPQVPPSSATSSFSALSAVAPGHESRNPSSRDFIDVTVQ